MSEDSRRPIPKEQLSAYERWELPAMESDHVVMPGGRRSGSDEERPPKPLTAEEIDAIREAAHAEGRAEGHAEGLAAGREEGLAAARKQIDEELARLRSIGASLLAPAAVEKDELEEAVVDLVAQVSRQVIARELRLDRSQLHALVDEVLTALPAGSDRIRVLVNTADLELMQDYQSGLEQELRMRADPALRPGDCRVETEFSLVDYTVDARFRLAIAEMVGQRYEQLAAMLEADLAEQQPVATARASAAPATPPGPDGRLPDDSSPEAEAAADDDGDD